MEPCSTTLGWSYHGRLDSQGVSQSTRDCQDGLPRVPARGGGARGSASRSAVRSPRHVVYMGDSAHDSAVLDLVGICRVNAHLPVPRGVFGVD